MYGINMFNTIIKAKTISSQTVTHPIQSAQYTFAALGIFMVLLQCTSFCQTACPSQWGQDFKAGMNSHPCIRAVCQATYT